MRGLILFVVVTLILFLTGCTPYMTYEEMEEAHEIAQTKEEKDELMKRILAFESNWEKALLYFEAKGECGARVEYNWYCDDVVSTEERKIKSVDGLVRVYKREHRDCGCVNTRKMMEALQQSQRRY